MAASRDVNAPWCGMMLLAGVLFPGAVLLSTGCSVEMSQVTDHRTREQIIYVLHT